MSHSSTEVTYRPIGSGHRARTAQVDLTRIPDPEAWLANRLGTLARFEIRLSEGTSPEAVNPSDAEGLDALASRRSAMQTGLATPRAARPEAATPPGRLQPSSQTTQLMDARP